ncbi:hypothetical protein C8Q76DRAFT_440313 [Earliella scabrosa]|nr:hypothetical protein C8Q76DRAFT_440313 [Earliella scabrosa]
MRLYAWLCLAGLLDVTLAAAALGRPATIHNVRGEFEGFGFLDGLEHKTDTERPIYHFGTETATRTTDESSAATSLSSTTSSATTSKGKHKEAESITTGTAYSIIGTIPPLESPSGSAPSAHPAAHTPTSASSPPGTPSAASAAGTSSSSSGGGSEWKIIGVAVIVFSAVAAILLLSVFFDHWWRFVRDLIWRRRRRSNPEELVPDWEKAEWDLRGEDRQRYPSFTSLPSLPVVRPPSQLETTERPHVQSPLPVAGANGRGVRDVHARGGALARQLSGTSGMRPLSTTQLSGSSSGYAGVGLVGLGLDRMGSTSRNGQVVSPRLAAGSGRSPAQQHTPRLGAGQAKPLDTAQTSRLGCGNGTTGARGGGNPFDDVHSPTPDDVYGGMAD